MRVADGRHALYSSPLSLNFPVHMARASLDSAADVTPER